MHDLRELRLHACRFAGVLSLSSLVACVQGQGVIGDYTDGASSTGPDVDPDSGSGSGSDSGSGTDTDAGCLDSGCDPDFAITHISGYNYAHRAIHRLGDVLCDGPACPEAVTPDPVDGMSISECLDSQEAQDSEWGPEEYCRLAPGWIGARLEIGFATPVQRDSFEHVRPRLDDPALDEAYLWHSDVIALEGPGTALRGDLHPGASQHFDVQSTVVNETCVDRLAAMGVPWTPEQLEEQCMATWDDGGTIRPLRMNPAVVFRPSEGRHSTESGDSCDTPVSGPDTCCNSCDRMLGPGIARYGVDGSGTRRSVAAGTAIACDPAGDPLIECRGLVLDVERDDGPTHHYAWDGPEQDWPVPQYDKLRETHPDDRPAGIAAPGPSCSSASDCAEGQACIGTNPAGEACRGGEECTARTCRAEWFGACEAGNDGSSYCVDRRFSARGAGACLLATADFADGSAGDRLAQCDDNGDGTLSPAECCDPALGGAAGCDPYDQPMLTSIARYDRHLALSSEAHCTCEEGQPDECAAALDVWCEAPHGTGSDPGPDSPTGAYAVPYVSAYGGVRWDEERGLLGLRLANLGNASRASVEACAEARGLIGGRSHADGWIANEAFIPELVEDHDLALCSGSTYRLVFAESDAEHHVRSAGMGTLDGRSSFVLETPQFRVVPDSLFPTDDMDVQGCTDFSLLLSNRPDPGPLNIRKIELREGAPDGPRIAGGSDCSATASPEEIAAGAIPCLTADAHNTALGELKLHIDYDVHGAVLQAGATYFVMLPGVGDVSEMADADAYAAAFHDACGMPLVLGETPQQQALSQMSFTVDEACLE